MTPPQCPVHGAMKARSGDIGNGYTGTVWVCAGWDGEGCPARAERAGWTQAWTVVLPGG
jgi:hypothetical protein